MQGHNRIPVVREVLSDLDTPLSVYLKLADGPFAYLFESVEGGARWGRYSIIGLPARCVYPRLWNRLVVSEEGEIVDDREVVDPLAEIVRIKARIPRAADRRPAEIRRRTGRLFRLRMRQLHRTEDSSADAKPDRLGMPDICLMLAEELAVFDNLKGKLISDRQRRSGRAACLCAGAAAAGFDWCIACVRPAPRIRISSPPTRSTNRILSRVFRKTITSPPSPSAKEYVLCRRHVPGADQSAPVGAVPLATARRLPRAARA